MNKEVNLSIITILVTGAGAPGIQGTIYSLKKTMIQENYILLGQM